MPADVSELLALAATLERSSGRLGRDGAQVVRKEAESVKRNMQANAPVRSGELRGSIKVDSVGSGRGGSMSATISAGTRYAFFQEFGTSRMAPQPFAEPAARQAEASFPSALEKLAADTLDL